MSNTTLPRIIRIGMQLFSGDPFWVLVREGIYQRGEQLQVELVPVEVDLWELPGEKQMELVEEVLALELHGLVAQAMAVPLARLIADAGIPIVFLTETGAQHQLITSPWGLDEVARTAASFIAGRINYQGRVLVLGGLMEGSDKGRSRLKGFRTVMDAHPLVEIEHITAPWTYQPAYEQAFDALSHHHRPFQAIFGLSDSLALAGLHAARELGLADDQTVVVGINGDLLALAAILEGSMAATVETPAVELGRQAVDFAVAAARGRALPPHFSYSPRLITRENVAQISMEKLVAMASLPGRLVGIHRHQEQERLIQLETSIEISHRVGRILDRRQLYSEIADLIRGNYGYDDAQIFIWFEREREFVWDNLDVEPVESQRIPLDQSGLLGYTFLHNQPTFIPDMRHSQRFPPDPYWSATRSRVILPIHQGTDIVGLLDLHSQRPVHHSSSALIGLQTLADQLGTALRNAELYGEALAARAEAERANQLKNRLLANVSHELRTPLNVIQGYSQAALTNPHLYGCELPPVLRRDLGHIYASSEHLAYMINDLLDLSRAEINELEILPEPLDPHSILTSVFESIKGSSVSGGQVEWRLRLPESLPQIYADPVRLRQIVLNLLSNARKFTARGHITLQAEALDQHLHVWVEDTGCGISAEQQRRIFETFSTVEQPARPGQGIGLGLRVTHELVKLHKGTLGVESTPDVGTTFRVLLPLFRPEALENRAVEPPPAMPRIPCLGQSETIPPHISGLTRRAIEYVWQNYAVSFSREEMAANLGVTAGYLSRLFRQDLGLTPWEYLTEVRIERATALLSTSSLSITEIAGLVGYNDAAYFTRVFKKETGRSPRSYRNATD